MTVFVMKSRAAEQISGNSYVLVIKSEIFVYERSWDVVITEPSILKIVAVRVSFC